MYIDGIGEVIAERIVEYARFIGFSSVNDLMNVNGIGNTKFAEIVPYVYVDSNNVYVTTFSESSYSETKTETETHTTVIHRVNINTCGKSDLMQLPGISEQLAENIINLRNEIGYFIRIEELSLVDGMTNNKLSAIWDYIYVE